MKHILCSGDYMAQPYISGALSKLLENIDKIKITATSAACFTTLIAIFKPTCLTSIWETPKSQQLLSEHISFSPISNYNELFVSALYNRSLDALNDYNMNKRSPAVCEFDLFYEPLFQGSPVLQWAFFRHAKLIPEHLNLKFYSDTDVSYDTFESALSYATEISRQSLNLKFFKKSDCLNKIKNVDWHIDPTAFEMLKGDGFKSLFGLGDAIITAANHISIKSNNIISPNLCLPFSATTFGRIITFLRTDCRYFDTLLGQYDASLVFGKPIDINLFPNLPKRIFDGIHKNMMKDFQNWCSTILIPWLNSQISYHSSFHFPIWLLKIAKKPISNTMIRYVERYLNHELKMRIEMLSQNCLYQ